MYMYSSDVLEYTLQVLVFSFRFLLLQNVAFYVLKYLAQRLREYFIIIDKLVIKQINRNY